ncbi:tRNA glutamyl-Q(34) synthetase GluQRS [Acidocella sp.]|uniref:tRNA glutamyl-Q(34) synthetase GluQRS n=1 Tax=Acidocella sp. TaxID=50710 RepID=UPI003D020054
MTIISRFAPSPTGLLHMGHAYSAWLGRQRADTWLVRMEDIDTIRCKPEFAVGIQEDLAWLGLNWDGHILFQTRHLNQYNQALTSLQAQGLLYPCFCTRAEIAKAQSAPHAHENIYPGTCRALPLAIRTQRMEAGHPYALRLDTKRACHSVGPLRFFDEALGWVMAEPWRLGDIVLARKDVPTSYHLCVVHDDSLQGVTHVIRGEDLREATHIQVLLQALLGYETPVYVHHKLLLGADGKRLAKRDKALTLQALRVSGLSPDKIIERLRQA